MPSRHQAHQGGSAMRNGLRMLVLLCLFWAGAAVFAPVNAQGAMETGQVDARTEKKFARIVLTFAKRPAHSIASQNGVLVLKFERPVDVDVSSIARNLPAYISAARRDSDGKSLRLALSRKVRINTSEADDQLYIDLLPEPWAGAPPALPPDVVAELARRAEAAELAKKEAADRERRRVLAGTMDIVVGEAPTFTRLEFRWKERVASSIQRKDKDVIITFERVGNVDLTAIRASLPRFLEGISSTERDSRLIVTLKVDPIRDVRGFEDGNAYVVDIQGTERGRSLEYRSDGTIIKSEMEEIGVPVTMLRGTGSGPGNSTGAPPAQSAAGSGPPPSMPPDGTAASAANAAPPMASGPAASGVAGEGGTNPTAKSASPLIDGITAEARLTSGNLKVELRFARQIAMSVFARDNVVWMVADEPAPIDIDMVRRVAPLLVRKTSVERFGDAQVIRLELNQTPLISAQPDGTNWVVNIGDRMIDTPRTVALRPRTFADGRALIEVEFEKSGKVHRLPDPIVGDDLLVVTAFGPSQAMTRMQQFVDFLALKTAHGLALIPHVDDLHVHGVDEVMVSIDRPSGLSLSSSGIMTSTATSPRQALEARVGYIDFEGWKAGPPEQFVSIRNALVARIGTADSEDKLARRIELARFFIAHRLGNEAVGVINVAQAEMPAAEKDASFRVLRGVANALARRFDAAERDLASADLDDLADTALWRGLAAIERQDWVNARRLLDKARAVLGNYPRAVQAEVYRNLALAHIELRDFGQADLVLIEAKDLDTSRLHLAHTELMRGRIDEGIGRNPEALQHLKTAELIRVPGISDEAALRHVVLAQNLGMIAKSDATYSLESIAMGWRGDNVEIEAYQRLATLYRSEGQYRRAFEIMKAAVTARPDSPITMRLQDEMRAVFMDLFLEGKADAMRPVEALALFFDYRDMTPPGRRGDEMIRALAGRLVDLDLLDQAINLLTHQVDNRLQGAAKAEVGAQLALVHLMNREPEKSLSVLRRTRQPTMASELERRRLMIEARSLAAIGRAELAIDLVGSNDSMDYRRMRADLLWDARRWDLVGGAIEATLREAMVNNRPLTDQARGDILRAAVAYAMEGREGELQRMRTLYGPRVANTPEASAFEVLTGPIETQGSEFRNLAKTIGGIDTMQQFLQEYRQRLIAPASARPQALGEMRPRG